MSKSISVAQVFIPSDVMEDIDKMDVTMNCAANELQDKTYQNARNIKKVFNAVKVALIVVAAIMLLLAILGFVLTIRGHQHSIYMKYPCKTEVFVQDGNLQERLCTSIEVSVQDAPQAWGRHVCQVSPTTGFCATQGRLTPEIYTQMVAAANESYALDHYAPRLVDLQNCNFVRDTFQEITTRFCPPLRRYLKMVEAGLG